jgi:DNA repair exonuclease SbcCD nuclease subunit
VKIVVTADVHIHPWPICSRDHGGDRLRDGLSVLEQSLKLAAKHDAAWIMAGDFKQPKTNWPQEALTGAHEILRLFPGVTKFMLMGNHDALGLGGSGLAPFKDCATVIESEAEEHRGILFVPFGADLTAVKKNKHLPIVAHAFLKGAFIGPEDFRKPGAGADLEDYGPFPVAFFGDIHKAQFRVPADPTTGRKPSWLPIEQAGLVRGKGLGGPGWKGEVFYPGSPYMQNWGERNDGVKGFLLADLKSGQVDMIESFAPHFVHVELDDPEALPEVLLHSAKDFVRIITDSSKWTQNALEAKGLTYRSLQIIERPRVEKRTTRPAIHAGMDFDEMLSGYMKAHPVPEGVDEAQMVQAMRNLWSGV